MKGARCGVCGSDRLRDLYWASDRNFSTTSERFLIAECSACRIAQTIPRPSEQEISHYYPPVYYPTSELSQRDYDRQIGKFQRDKLLRLTMHRSKGKLLDVGCGVGYFVKEAQAAGFDAQGIELSETPVMIGQQRWSLDLRCGDLLDSDYPPRSFDVITFWQAFEHMLHPVQVLDKTRDLLKPKGLLVIAIPNFNSIQSRIFRERWYHLEVPRHLFHYNPDSLSSLVRNHGFEVVGVNFHSREHNWAGILGSILHFAPSAEPFIHKLFRKTIGLYASRILAEIESRLRRGGTFELYSVRN